MRHAGAAVGDTTISWTHRPGTHGRSWNPTAGCALKSAGCTNCYAMKMARRFAGAGQPFEGLVNLKTGKWTGKAKFLAHRLGDPLTWREPSTVFVDSMSDLFYEKFTNEEIAAVFGVMAACPKHTFLILTKRPDRMRAWFAWLDKESKHRGDWTIPHWQLVEEYAIEMLAEFGKLDDKVFEAAKFPATAAGRGWPLMNVWLGVSTENQDAAHWRIPDLLATPAAVRFVSAEPLIGPIDFTAASPNGRSLLEDLNWLITGCESGACARECEVEWLRSLRDQCAAAGVAFFLKQAEESADLGADGLLEPGDDDSIAFGDRSSLKGRLPGGNHLVELPYLDGVQHGAFPEAR